MSKMNRIEHNDYKNPLERILADIRRMQQVDLSDIRFGVKEQKIKKIEEKIETRNKEIQQLKRLINNKKYALGIIGINEAIKSINDD